MCHRPSRAHCGALSCGPWPAVPQMPSTVTYHCQSPLAGARSFPRGLMQSESEWTRGPTCGDHKIARVSNGRTLTCGLSIMTSHRAVDRTGSTVGHHHDARSLRGSNIRSHVGNDDVEDGLHGVLWIPAIHTATERQNLEADGTTHCYVPSVLPAHAKSRSRIRVCIHLHLNSYIWTASKD